MPCPHCNYQTDATDRFCPSCGVSLERVESSAAMGSVPSLQPGTMVGGKYRIEGSFVAGGVNVYRATCQDSAKTVLIEETKPGQGTAASQVNKGLEPAQNAPTSYARLSGEDKAGSQKRAVASIASSRILPPAKRFELLVALDCHQCHKAYDYFMFGDREYLVLAPPQGKSLAELASEETLSEERAIDIIRQVCQCVVQTHAAGYIHLNIEPGNIYVWDDQASLFDFSRAMRQGTKRQEYLTTDGFSAPELLLANDADIDARADIYSIGAVMFWLISGDKVSFTGVPVSNVLSAVPSSELARIILTCLANDPGLRYKTVQELVEQLSTYQLLNKRDLHFDTALQTDRGMVREGNEDCCFVLESTRSQESHIASWGIYIVADGMGGHSAGEVASSKAVEVLSASILEGLRQSGEVRPYSQLVTQAIEKANTEVYNMACGDPQLSSMGTTVTIGLRVNDELYLGHVGDSRCYLIRDGNIEQLTEDHSVVGGLIRAGMITPEQAKTHPDRAKIYRCLGTADAVSVDTYEGSASEGKLTLQAGDKLVFCSDGLTGHVSDTEIKDCAERETSAESICRYLTSLANQSGGEDNISVIAIRVESGR